MKESRSQARNNFVTKNKRRQPRHGGFPFRHFMQNTHRIIYRTLNLWHHHFTLTLHCHSVSKYICKSEPICIIALEKSIFFVRQTHPAPAGISLRFNLPPVLKCICICICMYSADIFLRFNLYVKKCMYIYNILSYNAMVLKSIHKSVTLYTLLYVVVSPTGEHEQSNNSQHWQIYYRSGSSF